MAIHIINDEPPPRQSPPRPATALADPAAAILARAKTALEGLTKTLLLPLPLLLALALGLAGAKPEIKVSDLTLPIWLAQIFVHVSIAVFLLNAGRHAMEIRRCLQQGGNDAALHAMLEGDPAWLNPFARLPTHALPVACVGLIVGGVASFLSAIDIPLHIENPWVIFGAVALVHTAGVAAVLLGILLALLQFRRGWNAALFVAACVASQVISWYALSVAQAMRDDALSRQPPAAVAPR
jgi:lysylphosphatidylglycerol synthetase-like protein (DUF2156 family)